VPVLTASLLRSPDRCTRHCLWIIPTRKSTKDCTPGGTGSHHLGSSRCMLERTFVPSSSHCSCCVHGACRRMCRLKVMHSSLGPRCRYAHFLDSELCSEAGRYDCAPLSLDCSFFFCDRHRATSASRRLLTPSPSPRTHLRSYGDEVARLRAAKSLCETMGKLVKAERGMTAAGCATLFALVEERAAKAERANSAVYGPPPPPWVCIRHSWAAAWLTVAFLYTLLFDRAGTLRKS
jgi:hypothetical protein